MGLGLPVCEKCQVICEYGRDLFDFGKHGYYCPICGNIDPKDHTGLNEDRINRLKDNYRFLKFTLNK